ncbi:hypothetical protein Pan216_14100 [Planctomycetes bacterium Pan216]|uniref:Uncharacterized protein n=1 Tax=Kolteria novifilia TaxID=2527975 RepID=A0A518B0R0_9BACT|nr:hypothetical protein Pan216_14100 [Planctomycetes bacterium Pan216]
MTNVTVGQKVRVPLGTRVVGGVVIEDRGPIGVGGRHLFMVEIPNDPDEPDVVMRAEDELVKDTTPVTGLTEVEIQEFLENGGLVSILRRNMSGGRSQPSVWLCRSSLGNVTYTFDEERGLVGGLRIPFFSLKGERVFQPKVPEVVAFLVDGFGLSKHGANAVIRKVGTAP